MNKLTLHQREFFVNDIRSKQKHGLKELYNLRENNLRDIITLLNEPYIRAVNGKYMIKIQEQSTDLYNSLTDIVNFIDSGFKSNVINEYWTKKG